MGQPFRASAKASGFAAASGAGEQPRASGGIDRTRGVDVIAAALAETEDGTGAGQLVARGAAGALVAIAADEAARAHPEFGVRDLVDQPSAVGLCVAVDVIELPFGDGGCDEGSVHITGATRHEAPADGWRCRVLQPFPQGWAYRPMPCRTTPLSPTT